MIQKILNFLSALPNELYVFIISMLPIVELRGAVPIGAVLGIPFYTNFVLAVLGNLLPVPFILLFIPKILTFLERFKLTKPIVRWLRGKADKHSSKVIVDGTSTDEVADETAQSNKPDSVRKMTKSIFVALVLFVALPIPGTGAWTGALVAALFSLPKRSSFVAVSLGVIICGIIMSLASYGVLGFLSFLI